MSLITNEIRKSATEIYHGHDICSEKSKFLLKEVGLPNGLLPMEDMVECGHVKETGFVWLISKKKTEYKLKKINKLVQYGTEVTAYVEPNKIKKVTGVKAKELLMWITLNEIYVNDPPTGNIHFKTTAGLFRTFPTNVFLAEEPEKPVVTEVPEGANKKAKENKTAVNEQAVEVKEV